VVTFIFIISDAVRYVICLRKQVAACKVIDIPKVDDVGEGKTVKRRPVIMTREDSLRPVQALRRTGDRILIGVSFSAPVQTGPPSLLCSGYLLSFPGINRPVGAWY
jgi:hypothetical protein